MVKVKEWIIAVLVALIFFVVGFNFHKFLFLSKFKGMSVANSDKVKLLFQKNDEKDMISVIYEGNLLCSMNYFENNINEYVFYVNNRGVMIVTDVDMDGVYERRVVESYDSDEDCSDILVDLNSDNVFDLRFKEKNGNKIDDKVFFKNEWHQRYGIDGKPAIEQGDKAVPIEFKDGKWQLVTVPEA